MASPPSVGRPLVECSFLIPLRGDKSLCDGGPHDLEAWEWFHNEYYVRFGGGTAAPGVYRGVWKNPQTGERIEDESYRFMIALPREQLDDLRGFLRELCQWFHQQCIYLSVAGYVEFPGSEAVSDAPS
jgi:hypothetical protein